MNKMLRRFDPPWLMSTYIFNMSDMVLLHENIDLFWNLSFKNLRSYFCIRSQRPQQSDRIVVNDFDSILRDMGDVDRGLYIPSRWPLPEPARIQLECIPVSKVLLIFKTPDHAIRTGKCHWGIQDFAFRYVELLYPFWHKVHFKMKYLYTVIALVWILGIGLNAADMIPTSKVTHFVTNVQDMKIDRFYLIIFMHSKISVWQLWQLLSFQIVNDVCLINHFWPSDEMKKAFGILVIFFQLFIPFIILVFCYGNIAWMLSRRINTDMTDTNVDNNGLSSECQSPTQASSSGKRKQLADVHKDKFQLARRNTIKTLLIVGCCFIGCWSQNQVLYLMFNLGYNLDWNSGYYHFTVLMVFVKLHCQSIYLPC